MKNYYDEGRKIKSINKVNIDLIINQSIIN